MTFQSLYRKYRPQRFADLLGQEHVTTAVRNAVRDDRVGHAYLFSGPRGTGKTTTARLLAKALNCADRGDDGEPCGACDSCVEIARGSSMDVIELDAASNNKVDEMRDLLSRVAYRSAGGRWRVYIVDEVHMLTKGASNALLKTLEEPPDHVVFVLATTEPEQVLATIRSRTQHFEFGLLPTEDLAGYLGEIVGHEKIEADPEALTLVARRGGGSVRDALSLLDQVLALGEGAVDADRVRGLVDAVPFEQRALLVDAVASEDPGGALSALHSLLQSGADPRQVADDLLRHLRDVYLVTASRGQAHVDALPEEQARLEEQGRTLGAAVVERALDTLGEAAVDMRRAPDPRIVLEVALVRVARRQAGTRTEVLLDRVERLEKAIEGLRAGGAVPAAGSQEPSPPPGNASDTPATKGAAGGAAGAARRALGAVRGKRSEAAPDPSAVAPSGPPAEAPSEVNSPPSAPAEPPASEPAQARSDAGAADAGFDIDDVILAWPKALEGMKAVLKAVAREAQPIAVDGATVVLSLPKKLDHQLDRLKRDTGKVADLLSSALGRSKVGIRVEVTEDGLLDGGPVSSSSPAASSPADGASPDEPESIEDLEPGEVVEDAQVDSVQRLQQAFDATTVDDDS